MYAPDIAPFAVARQTIGGGFAFGSTGDDSYSEVVPGDRDDLSAPVLLGYTNACQLLGRPPARVGGFQECHGLVAVDIFEDIFRSDYGGEEIKRGIDSCRRHDRLKGITEHISLFFAPAPLMACYCAGRTRCVGVVFNQNNLSILAVWDGFEIGEMTRRIPHSFAFPTVDANERQHIASWIARHIFDSIAASPIDIRVDLQSNIALSCSGSCDFQNSLTADLQVHMLQLAPKSRVLQGIFEGMPNSAWIGLSILGSLSSYALALSQTGYPTCLKDWIAVVDPTSAEANSMPPGRIASLIEYARYYLTLPDTAYHSKITRLKAKKLLIPVLLKLSKKLPEFLVMEIYHWLVAFCAVTTPLGSIRITAGEAERRQYEQQQCRSWVSGSSASSTTLSQPLGRISSPTRPDYEVAVCSVDFSAEDEVKWRSQYDRCIGAMKFDFQKL